MSTPHADRRRFCQAILGGAAGLALGGARAAEPARRSNILLITGDDLGPHLGCYGDGQAPTPNLDGLAEEGVRFELAYVTQASCSPSRSSMFTGLYPHQNGQIGLSHRGYSMREGMQTLSGLLKRAGYRNGVIGKIHVQPVAALPFDYRRTNVQHTRDVRKVAEETGEFIAECGDNPFFLMVNYFDPHRPLVDQVEGIPERPLTPEEAKPFDFLGLDTPKVRQEVAGYYNCAARVDAGVGLLLDALEKSGHADDTLVIFIGDHGPPFTRGKTTCYEAGLRIPFIVRWPGRAQAGHVSRALVSTVDILPTAMAAAGLDAPPGLAGRSLAPLLQGAAVYWRDTLCAEYNTHHAGGYYPRRSIRDERYKLIVNLLPDRPNPILGVDGCAAWPASRDDRLEGTPIRAVYDRHQRPPAEELYDLQADPVEFHNLAGKPEYAAVQEKLRAALQAWREETSDPLLDPEKLAAQIEESKQIQATFKAKQKQKK